MSLIESAKGGNAEAVKLLIGGGATDVNAVDEGGCTALWWGVNQGHVECATALVDAGADMEKADREGYTPLLRASFNGRVECVRVRPFGCFECLDKNMTSSFLFAAAPHSAQG